MSLPLPEPLVDAESSSRVAAAQAAADRIAQQIAASKDEIAPAAPPAAEASADADDAPADGAGDVQEMSRGGYTFCKRYTRAKPVRVPLSEGLQVCRRPSRPPLTLTSLPSSLPTPSQPTACRAHMRRQSIDVYENLGLVGRGAFNKIYKARHRQTGQIVALKAMQLEALTEAGQVRALSPLVSCLSLSFSLSPSLLSSCRALALSRSRRVALSPPGPLLRMRS